MTIAIIYGVIAFIILVWSLADFWEDGDYTLPGCFLLAALWPLWLCVAVVVMARNAR